MTDDTSKDATSPPPPRRRSTARPAPRAGTRRAPRKAAAAPAAAPAAGLDQVSQDEFDSQLMRQQDTIRQRIAVSAAAKVVPHPTVADRTKTGKIARAHVTREEIGAWAPAPDRVDPVDLLVGQETSRVKELVPVRHARMATSAFAFYRGGALIMAADLAPNPRSGLGAQLCGDAHLSNFGMFAAPDRSLVFDVNDFDETHPGPFEWDVKRLSTSFLLAARDNGIADKHGIAAAGAAAASYRESMINFAAMRESDIWYSRVDAGVLTEAARTMGSQKQKAQATKTIEGAVAKARTRDAWSAIEKLTEVVDGQRQFRNQPPLLARLGGTGVTYEVVNALFREYRATLQDDRQELLKRYQIIDVGHKVVGVGSVGLLAFVLLMRGRDDNDLMVLQVKQAQASVLEAFTRKSVFSKHGHRVVTGQRLMQAASDSFLGWIEGPMGRSYYVRQLRDMKWSPDPAGLTGERLARYAILCGHTLARAHARSGDAVAVASYLGGGRAFDKAMAAFSLSYADQVALDYQAFMQAIADGRIEAHEDASGAEGARASDSLAAEARSRSRRRPPKAAAADAPQEPDLAEAAEVAELEASAIGTKSGKGAARSPKTARRRAPEVADPAGSATVSSSGKATAGAVSSRRAAGKPAARKAGASAVAAAGGEAAPAGEDAPGAPAASD